LIVRNILYILSQCLDESMDKMHREILVHRGVLDTDGMEIINVERNEESDIRTDTNKTTADY
jgi:hypothetical protein